MSFDKPGLIIDNGSYNIKAGFSCDNHPISIFRTLVGRPNYLKGKYGKGPYEVYVGDSALMKINELDLNSPVVNGTIVHWDNMERIWHHVYYRELKSASEERSVLLANSTSASMDEKIKCSEIFFEALNAPALCIQSQSVLAMYGSGHTTGICVDMGHDTTDVVPIFEGGLLKFAHIETGLAGAQLSGYLKECLGPCDTKINSLINVEDLKKHCYITNDCAMARNNCVRKYLLPSGEEINVTNECFMSAEMLFQPDLVLKKKTNYIPLHEAVISTILKCDAELQQQMYNSIALCGGVAMIPGVDKRLTHEMEQRVDEPIYVSNSSESYAVAWLGGAVFAALEGAKKMWIEKEQYEEFGSRIIKNKFSI